MKARLAAKGSSAHFPGGHSPGLRGLGNNRATRSPAGAHQCPVLLLSYHDFLIHFSQELSPSLPTYTSLRPSLVSNTHRPFSYISVSLLPLLWAWIKIHPRSLGSGARSGFHLRTSLLACDICLNPRVPQKRHPQTVSGSQDGGRAWALPPPVLKFYRNGIPWLSSG